MLLRRLDLPLSDSSEGGIRRRTDGTLHIVVDAVETAFVEGMAAEEVHGWQVQGSAAGLAAAGLEDEGLGREVLQFLFFGVGFGFVACD